ncbi:MAG: hypothetical protein ABI867_02260 [Kofleriaceae bacterium]
MRLCTFATVALLVGGCPGPKYKAPATLPTTDEVSARLDKARKARSSFRVETLMDYWLGKDRAKGTVLVMGTASRQVRFNAVKPDGNLLVDMACDGANFTYVNFQNNCQLAGPCTKQSIGALLHVDLEPDDFHSIAQGTPPMIANAKGSVTWDAKRGYELVALEGPEGKQSITIDARDNHFDVIASSLVDPAGKVVWSVENTDFRSIKDAAGAEHRVPGKTRFKAPTQNADLLVEWKDDERAINLPIDAGKFVVPIPAGLPSCGGATATTNQPSPTSKTP